MVFFSLKKEHAHQLVFFSSDLGDPKLAWIYQKNEWPPSRKMLCFVNCCNAAMSKIGHDFSNKVLQKLKLKTIFLIKIDLLNWYFQMKDKFGFWHKNWLGKYNFGTFWRCHNTLIYKIQHFPWSPFIFFDKIKLILDTPGQSKKNQADINLDCLATAR